MSRIFDSHRGWSQREKVVRYLLFNTGWHSIHDIHREVGFCRLNSRVAEARKVFKRDGHPFDIKHSIRDGAHGYELVPLESPAAAAAAGPSSGSNLGPSSGSPDTPRPTDGPLECNCAGTFDPERGEWRDLHHPSCPASPFIHEGQETLL